MVAQHTQQICSRDSWEKSRPEVEDVAGSHLGERLLQIDQERTDLPFKGAWAPLPVFASSPGLGCSSGTRSGPRTPCSPHSLPPTSLPQ